MSCAGDPLPPGWAEIVRLLTERVARRSAMRRNRLLTPLLWSLRLLQLSRSFGRPYYVNATTGESVWERPTTVAAAAAPSGGAAASSSAAASSDEASPLDLEAALPPGCAPASIDTLCIKSYDPIFRADGCWSIRQLGLVRAHEELREWQALASTASTSSTALAPPTTLRDVARSLVLCAAALTSSGLSGLLASAWDAKTRQYVLDRSAISGTAVSGAKRLRADFEAASAAPTVSSDALPTAAAATDTVVRPWEFYARLHGAELFTSPLLKPNDVIRQIYQSGKVSPRGHRPRSATPAASPASRHRGRTHWRAQVGGLILQVVTPSGKVNKISAAVGPYEGIHLYQLVLDNKFTRTLEVGMANGLSSLFICQVRALSSSLPTRHMRALTSRPSSCLGCTTCVCVFAACRPCWTPVRQVPCTPALTPSSPRSGRTWPAQTLQQLDLQATHE